MLKRLPLTAKVTFTSSTTGVPESGPSRPVGGRVDVQEMAFGGLHVESGLDGRVVNFLDNGPWGSEVVLQKAVATGFNEFNEADLRHIGPSLSLSFTLDSSATGSFWLKMKS
jgi:hypothetical protein